jgi:hypothetical protein
MGGPWAGPGFAVKIATGFFLWSVDARYDKGMASPMLPENRLLVLLSILVLLLAVAAIVWLPSSEYSALGTLFGGVGSVLAVMWFSAGLFYQSRQLKEQREQFLLNFNQLREDARRSALTFARDILREAEDKALKQNPALKSINDLTTVYPFSLKELQVILQSKDPAEVQDAVRRWSSNSEAPAVIVLGGIKNAADIYFTAIGQSDIDYSVEAEDFISMYGPLLWKLPYFEAYTGVATILSGYMKRLQPGRKAALLAFNVAGLKTLPPGVMKKKEIIEDVKQHRQAGLPVPAIAEDL